MSWATIADVRARWPAAPADDALIQAWLDDAETIIRAEYPLVDDWLAADPELLPVLVLVQARMVVRALAAPIGVNREQVGDTSVSYTPEQAGLGLTDADRALLDGFGPQHAFTVDTLPGPERDYYDGLWLNWNRPGEEEALPAPRVRLRRYGPPEDPRGIFSGAGAP